MDDKMKHWEQLEATGITAGTSTCPVCKEVWTVTPMRDCFMPACGCYGTNASAGNPDRPCEPCGMRHFRACEKARQN